MRNPTTHVRGNLRFTRTGQVWADYLLAPVPYGPWQTDKHKAGMRALHTGLIRALPGESLLLGVCTGVDPGAVIDRMLAEVDLAACPDWASECRHTLEWLDQFRPGHRIYWLSFPVAGTSVQDQAVRAARSAVDGARRHLGLPRRPVPDAEYRRWRAQADALAATLPALFDPTPATPGQMVWLHHHQTYRGLFADGPVPDPTDTLSQSLLAAMPEPLLDEGGLTDRDRAAGRAAAAARVTAVQNRYLKVVDATAPTYRGAAYQVPLVIAGTPAGGSVFPGSELLGRIGESGVDVDWAIRLTVTSSRRVAAANTRKLRDLNEQYDQRETDIGVGSSGLDRVARLLVEYAKILEGDQAEVQAQVTTVLTLAAATAQDLTPQVEQLRRWCTDQEYTLAAPVGLLPPLWWATVPGTPPTAVVRDYAEVTTSRNLAAWVPAATTGAGDTQGSLLGIDISHGPLLDETTSHGPADLVFVDPEGASDAQTGGSIALVGEMGAGKTATLMKLAGDVIARGGTVVGLDRTTAGEWGRWAHATTRAAVIDTTTPEHSLDPLRWFGPTVGAPILGAFLATLLNVGPNTSTGADLAEVLTADYLTEHDLGCLDQVLTHLAAGPFEGAPVLARRARAYARIRQGRAVFDPTLPALDGTHRALIVRTDGVPLPSRDELALEHLFNQLPREKVYGRALHTLVVAAAQHLCFADSTRLGVFVVPEAHALTVSPEAERLGVEMVRDGRKHRAALFVDSQDVDFGQMGPLFGIRLVMRQTDPTLAVRALRWAGLVPEEDPVPQHLLEEVAHLSPKGAGPHRMGEAFLRDNGASGHTRITKVKVVLPHDPRMRQAAVTSGSADARTSVHKRTSTS